MGAGISGAGISRQVWVPIVSIRTAASRIDCVRTVPEPSDAIGRQRSQRRGGAPETPEMATDGVRWCSMVPGRFGNSKSTGHKVRGE